MRFKPRPYQEEADQALAADLAENPTGNPLVVVPTGGGKAYLIGKAMQRILREDPNARIINATHVSELVVQNYQECLEFWPDAPAGVYSAGAGRRQTHKRITFAGVQSIYKKARAFGRVTHLLVDEAHLISRNSTGMYRKLINVLTEINPQLRIIGYTATPYRLDTGGMIGGENALFHRIAFDVRLDMLVREGYLCPLRSKDPTVKYDLSNVGGSGDFNAKQMDAAINTVAINTASVDEMIAAGQDRLGWLAFCVSVEQAEAVVALLNARGYPSAVVHGDLDKNTRKRRISDYKAQRLRCLVSVNVLTTGFNAPHVDLIALMRATKSTGLYVQMLGRGTRLSPQTGKVDCLVLDYGENIKRFGPVDMLPSMPPVKVPGAGDAPIKVCPECSEEVHISIMTCPDCGFDFPEPEKEVITSAETDAVMASYAFKDEYLRPVIRCNGYIHSPTDGRPPSLRMEYVVNRNGEEILVKEWLPFEGSPSGKGMCQKFWLDAGGNVPTPSTTAEAHSRMAQGEIHSPASVVVSRSGNYWNVASRSFVDRGRTDFTKEQLHERGYTGKEMAAKLGKKTKSFTALAKKNGIVSIGKDSSGTLFWDRERIDLIVAKMVDA